MKKVPSGKIFSLVAVIIIMVISTGCSAVYRYRGLSTQINKKQNSGDLKLDSNYQWKLSKHGAGQVQILSKKHRISFQVFTNAQEEQILTVGPSLFFISLPIIPWPPGIYKAITKRSADAVIPNDLLVRVNIQGRMEEANLEIDFSNVDIEIEPSMGTRGFWQVIHWTNSSHQEYEAIEGLTKILPFRSSFVLTLPSISSTIRTIKIKLNDVRADGEKIDLPAFVFEKGTGFGMYNGVIGN